MKQHLLAFMVVAILLIMPHVRADPFNQTITPEEQATFDHILEPVMKVYNMVKYIATFIAVIILLFAGISYMVSGSDPKRRENAKSTVMYVIIGLIVIWAAPLVVQFIVG